MAGIASILKPGIASAKALTPASTPGSTPVTSAISKILNPGTTAAKTLSTTNPNPSNLPLLGPSASGASTAEEASAGIAATQPAAATAPVGPQAWANDPIYNNAVNTINSNLARLTSNKDLAGQRVNADYDTAVDTTKKTSDTNMSSLQNRLANQGIGYSGVNVSEQSKLLDTLQTQLGTLTQGKTRSLEDIARDYADQQAGYQNQLGAAEADRAGRETTRQTTEAADAAQAAAANTTANENRQWMNGITQTLTGLTQPKATPTGAMALPPPPAQIVQQALAQLPPPAAKTPQQQAADSGVDPKLLQSTLSAVGFDPGPVDGIIGIKTQRALAQLKQKLGLPATADMTPDIWTKIQAYAVNPEGTAPPPLANVPATPTPLAQITQNASNRLAANPQGFIPRIFP